MKEYTMKYCLCFYFFLLTAGSVFAQDMDYIRTADQYYQKRNSPDPAGGKLNMVNIDKAIMHYEKVLKLFPHNDELLYKYSRAVDFKYTLLPLNWNENTRRKIFEDLIEKLEQCYEKKPDSVYLNCSLARIWGRYGELLGGLTAARKGVAGKIKGYAEKLYKLDKTFDHYSAGLILGRLHYKAPTIPLLLTWPDMNESKKYLEEVYQNHSDFLFACFFLADTLYELGEKKRAIQLYKKVMSVPIDPDLYYEQLNVKKQCEIRMKELGL